MAPEKVPFHKGASGDPPGSLEPWACLNPGSLMGLDILLVGLDLRRPQGPKPLMERSDAPGQP